MSINERVPVTVSRDGEPEVILTALSSMVAQILGEGNAEVLGIAMETRFFEDLELESIDLVMLAGQVQERWGERVNLAEFIEDKDLDAIFSLTFGQLVDYIAQVLHEDASRS